MAKNAITGAARSQTVIETCGNFAVAANVAVERLAPRCRETFVLVRQHGLTYAQAAEVMGTSEHTVKIQMQRALAALRRHLAAWLPE